jgi:hypothetical protein
MAVAAGVISRFVVILAVVGALVVPTRATAARIVAQQPAAAGLQLGQPGMAGDGPVLSGGDVAWSLADERDTYGVWRAPANGGAPPV